MMTSKRAMVKPDTKDVTIPGPWLLPTKEGDKEVAEVHLKVRQPTRSIIEEAAWKANVGDGEVNHVVFKRELAMHLIAWWDLPYHVSNGWDLLGWEMGEAIEKACGIQEVIDFLRGKASEEVQAAKNSLSGGAAPPEPPLTPDSSSTTASGT